MVFEPRQREFHGSSLVHMLEGFGIAKCAGFQRDLPRGSRVAQRTIQATLR
ncbi:hypothetical protein Z945_434 [Sulfitobacter noctilucae]|nr:hypothetical protein Z945_434 [Sulfitobacter noctilucae]